MPTEDGAAGGANELVSTGVAAKALGVAHNTLHRWWKQGIVEPESITVGGHARWNIADLRDQIRKLRSPDQSS